jgi:UDP-glucose:(heptosyl)LPS alpha-1,3-glucosyltransferase
MARQYADHSQTILALSRSVADDFRRFHQVSPERVRIIYNGVDADHYSPASCAVYRESMRRRLGVEPGRFLALIVAQNLRLKGVPTLLRAMARLTRERLPLDLIVVGGKQLPSWRRWTDRLGAGGVVRFIGPVEDPLPYYAAADLYVHPTLYDTCSLVVLEAAACGLPLITSRCNGAAELLEDGRDCLLLSDPTDPRELAARIGDLLDAPLRRRMGAAARQTALRHTFEHNVDQVLEVYQEVLDRRARLASEYSVWTARVSDGGRAGPLVRAKGVAMDGRSPIARVPYLNGVLAEQEHSHENRAGR